MYIIKTSAGDRDWVADRNLNCSDLDLKKNRDQEWIAKSAGRLQSFLVHV